MSVLDRVQWPAVYRLLRENADQATEARAAAYDDAHTRFAVLVNGEHVCALRGQLCQAGFRDDVDRADVVAHWLKSTAHLAMAAVWVSLQPQDQQRPPVHQTLLVDLELPELPLMPLAAELGRRGGMEVRACSLPPGIPGAISYQHRRIELDVAQAGEELAQVWAHELSHWLDPWSYTDHDEEQMERYADDLGALLLRHQPATLAEVAPLADLAHDAVTTAARWPVAALVAVLDTDVPPAGAPSIAAFRALPILDEPASAA